LLQQCKLPATVMMNFSGWIYGVFHLQTTTFCTLL
jgi:hypothetical protein